MLCSISVASLFGFVIFLKALQFFHLLLYNNLEEYKDMQFNP